MIHVWIWLSGSRRAKKKRCIDKLKEEGETTIDYQGNHDCGNDAVRSYP